MALKAKVLPPTIKVDHPLDSAAPGSAPVYLNTEKRPWFADSTHPRRAGLSAFGFGGSNFHLVLEEADPLSEVVVWDDCVQILPFSGESPEQLISQLDAIDAAQPWAKWRSTAVRLREAFDSSKPHRLTLTIEKDQTDLKRLIAGVRQLLAPEDQPRQWAAPDGMAIPRASAAALNWPVLVSWPKV